MCFSRIANLLILQVILFTTPLFPFYSVVGFGLSPSLNACLQRIDEIRCKAFGTS